MHRFTSNPPSRQVRPYSAYTPSQRATRRPPTIRRAAIDETRYMPTEDIIAGFDRYFQRSGMAPTSIGRMLANDPRLFGDIRNGRELGDRVRTRLVRFLEESAGA